jgi:SAM-dependent methyltransferase
VHPGADEPADFRAALLRVPPDERDGWLDAALGLGEIPDDGPELPRGCVPYLPCPVEALLHVVEHVGPSDVFVDIGAGVGRALAFVHRWTGAGVIGVEIQPRLVAIARQLAARSMALRMACIEGDAARLARYLVTGSVFFLYCPFSGRRLARLLDDLEPIAHTRTIRICAVDVPLPPCEWLTLETAAGPDVAIYRSTIVYDAWRRRSADASASPITDPNVTSR